MAEPRLQPVRAALAAGALIVGAALQFSASPADAVEPTRGDVPVAVTTLTSEDIAKLPPITRDFSQLAFLQPNQPVAVPGSYNRISIRGVGSDQADGAPPQNRGAVDQVEAADFGKIDLPMARGTLMDGSPVTRIVIPKDTQPGFTIITFQPENGEPFDMAANVYLFLRSWIEQDKLRSYQRAQFGFELSFGRGPGRVYLKLVTAGPISYKLNGEVQVLNIDEQGFATLTDSVRSLKGSPAGTPFAINPIFLRLDMAKKK